MSNESIRDILRARLKQGGIFLSVGGDGGPSFPLTPQMTDDVLGILVETVLDANAVPDPIEDDVTAKYPKHVEESMPRVSVILVA